MNQDTHDDWRGKEYAFYRHEKCEAFPCHEMADTAAFNCLFCYCPLYFLDEACGGDFAYTKSGVKDCSACLIPHQKVNYGLINEKLAAAIRSRQQQEKNR